MLLWLVCRHRSRVARDFVIVPSSLVGGVLYGLGVVGGARLMLIGPAFFVRAAPLRSRQVRRHVHTG